MKPLYIARALGLVMLSILLALGQPGSAQAEVRRELAPALQAAQTALKEQHPQEALDALAPLRQRGDLNPEEQLLLARLTAAAAVPARQFALARPSLERLLGLADLALGERAAFLQTLVNVCINLKDYECTVRWSREGWALGAEPARFRLVLLQALGLLGRHAQVVAEVQRAQSAAAPPLTEAEWRLLGVSQLELRDQAGYVQTLWQLLRAHPRQEYWADLLPRLSQQSGLDPRLDLDLYRLMEETDNLEDEADFLTMAQLAAKAGLPDEAVRVLERAQARGWLKDAAPQQLLQQQRKRAVEDAQSLAQQRETARDANDWAQLGEMHASAGRWSDANEAFAKALALGGSKRPQETGLHYGRSLVKAGQPARAREVLAQVSGAARPLAELWLLRARAAP